MKKENKTTAVAAEEMVTVSAAATEIATQGEIEAAKAADKAAKKAEAEAKKAQKAAEISAKNETRLLKAQIGADGKFTVTILYEGNGPMAYVLDTNYKKIRLDSRFTYQLIDDGRANKITPAEFNKIMEDAKAEKKSAKKTDKNKTEA